MGTNYYLRYNMCEHCQRYDQLHIGKNSYGWEFSFRGYREGEWQPQPGIDLPILTFEHWELVLPQGRIFDEYGTEIGLEDFIKLVVGTKGKQNHYDYMANDYPKKSGLSPQAIDLILKDEWKDPQGWSFTDAPFS